MSAESLEKIIKERKARGDSSDDIKTSLINNGYKESDVTMAMFRVGGYDPLQMLASSSKTKINKSGLSVVVVFIIITLVFRLLEYITELNF